MGDWTVFVERIEAGAGLTNGEHIRDVEFLLLASGALPEEECAALRAHAAGCAECSAKLAEARGQAAVLAFLAPQERPAATIKAELFARIRAEREADHRYRWPTRGEKEVSALKTDVWFPSRQLCWLRPWCSGEKTSD